MKIAKFCEIDASEDVIDKVVEASTFKSMKKAFTERNKEKESEGKMVKKNHIRQGKSGKWRKTFTEDQIAIFDKHIEEKHKKYGDDLPINLWAYDEIE